MQVTMNKEYIGLGINWRETERKVSRSIMVLSLGDWKYLEDKE